ncbi:uncharacterized protein LOC122364166 [Amphibalanus amphitrite]|uniref:uncharacterized protein LOC122364166 n=1 Tax=Amphibalanus amphitrite TaxID=1232801 RepID=UPI001C90BB21|nr:uncharacterized protein LOC122364166 [Amphibalanus amphitrite]
MAVNLLPPLSNDDSTMFRDFFTYLTSPNPSACRQLVRFGGVGDTRDDDGTPAMDGHKFVCLDPEFALRSSDQCLVYSFGIATDWSFDMAMERFGCDVQAFDPFVNYSSPVEDAIQFTQMAVGDRNERRDGVEVRTLDFFVERLGHRSSTIHYLKMDVEYSEYGVLRQQTEQMRASALFRNVEQIGIELHFKEYLPLEKHVDFYRSFYGIFLAMQEMGFYVFSSEPNLMMLPTIDVPGMREKVTTAMEVVWLKSSCATR